MNNSIRAAFCICAAILAAAVLLIPAAATAKDPFRIVGYLPDYRFRKLDAKHAGLLTDLILFAAEPGSDGQVDLGRIAGAPWETLWAIREQYGTRLHLCLGGWGKSDRFSKVVRDDAARSKLTSSVVQTLLDRKLNGLDLDWEYPQTTEDWDGYVKLLSQLKGAFASHDLSLSITIAPSRELPRQAWEIVDTVQLMSYDYGRRHSTLEQAQLDLQSFINQGIPNEKIVLGLPFYGRHITERTATTYAQVARQHSPAPEVDEIADLFFNGRLTVQRKTESALDAGAGGVMVWEIGQDTLDDFSLLRSISQTVKSRR